MIFDPFEDELEEDFDESSIKLSVREDGVLADQYGNQVFRGTLL